MEAHFQIAIHLLKVACPFNLHCFAFVRDWEDGLPKCKNLASVPKLHVTVAPYLEFKNALNSTKAQQHNHIFTLVSISISLCLSKTRIKAMVSKVKRLPIKSIKDVRNNRRWRRKTPIKNVVAASSAVITCIHRRITKLFSKLARLSSTHKKTSYKILKKTASDFLSEQEQDAIRRTLVFDSDDSPLLPPSLSHRRTVFLDLDETLVHSKASPPPERFDFVVRPVIDGEPMDFYVLKRPGVDEFLESLARKFEVVVFTAALKEYASMVLDRLDKNRFISHRLYRDSCRNVDGKLVKDLSEMGRDLKRVVIVDDNPNSYANQPENAIPIRSFVDDLWDRELWKLRSFFDGSECYDDMRDAVKHYVTMQQC
ncbi:hypothetical protein VNO77_44414 [Canavalia gladiata]|uniref:FCP1 homology domain-containing protein n=1 Tax=Canavalia gladiata TaxID=3824 RepID=A0AAN9PQC0_CANGL